ncbi:GNAT family N-acetyltransferase [Cytobacillus horneckiae]|uniref:GNAT family N-acetyltransferase n=1 Tax=Cytobacillus horneckiae TaxID=549687 RepID=UPI003D20C246
MTDSNIKIVCYNPKYAKQTVQMWRDSKEKAIGQKEKHSFENHIYFFNHLLLKDYKIELALTREQVVGFVAFSDHEISQLYVHVDYQGKGIGLALLNKAKESSSGRLILHTFEINLAAQLFYERNGFKIISRGHENEENLPDIKYEWKK